MRIAVVGASGFVGKALSLALVEAGHHVVALSRRAPHIPGTEGHAVDVADQNGLQLSLEACDIAYYLVHSLGGNDFSTRDRELAETFRNAASAVGVSRVVYLGGLGDDPDSEHLMSRQEVGSVLAMGEVDVVELRAAVVLGAGGISFEMLRYITERLPFMVCPRWVRTSIQPIALADMLMYLVAAIEVAPGIYEIGGADVTSYKDMIGAYATARGLRRRLIVDVPYLTPRLSSYWLDLVTPVDRRVSHALIESLSTEVVVNDRAHTDAAFGISPMGLPDAIAVALADQVNELHKDLFTRKGGLLDGIYTVRIEETLSSDLSTNLDDDLNRLGGSYEWYGLAFAWRLRALLGRLVGERWSLTSGTEVVQGASVDWWTVVQRRRGELILRSKGWFPGDAWLGYQSDAHTLVQVGAFRSKGIPGFLYWKLLQPIHRSVFHAMARHRVRRASGSTLMTKTQA